jgi:hypothetical protein
MEGCELGELLQPAGDHVIDHGGLSELSSSVHDAVRNGRDVVGRRLERRDRCRGSVRDDEGELQARRAGVDDENAVAAQ